MRVTRLPTDPGPAAWNELLPAAAPPEQLKDAITADWLVIGAGFAGLAAARRLRLHDPNGRIVVLEAKRVAEGPAGRNSGFMVDLPHDLASEDYGGDAPGDLLQIRNNRAAIEFAADAVAAYGIPEEAFRRSGKINAAATEKGHRHNLTFARHLDALGEPYTLRDGAEMRALTGTEYYRSGLFTPGTVMLQPAMFVRGLAEGLRGEGVQVFENTPVVALKSGSVWRAETPEGAVTSPKVILAVNGHAESFGQYRGRLMHVFTYASMTRALTPEEVKTLGGTADWGLTPADPMGTTVRRISGTGGDRIVIRNRFTYNPDLEASERLLRRVSQDHDRAYAARFPMLKGIEMAYRWGGRLCLSRNNVQAVDEVAPGLFSACCQNGLGTAKGTFAGMMAADLATGQTSDQLTAFLAEPDPVRLPPRILAQPGAMATLRWMEWRAGDEL